MIFLPYEKLTIKTKLRPEEVLQNLNNVVEPRKHFRGWKKTSEKSYEGNVEGLSFNLFRIIYYRNSFLPVIKGKIESDIGGSSIQISMHPHILVILFMVIWMAGAGWMFFSSFSFEIFKNDPRGFDFIPDFLYSPFSMILFAYALILGGFKFESVKSKKFFKELFEASEVEEFSLSRFLNINRGF